MQDFQCGVGYSARADPLLAKLAGRNRHTAVIGRPDFVAAKPPVRPLPTHLTGRFATRPAAAFLDLAIFPPAGLTTVVKLTRMPA